MNELSVSGFLGAVMKCVIVVGWVLLSVFISIAYINVLAHIIYGYGLGGSTYGRPGVGYYGMMSFALIAGGLISLYVNFLTKKKIVFLMMMLPVFFLFWITMLFSHGYTAWSIFADLGLMYPFLLWAGLKRSKRDPVEIIREKLIPYTQSWLKKKTTRIFIAGYFAWLFVLLMTNNLEFHDIMDFDYYHEDRGWFLFLLPLAVVPTSIYLIKWCKKGE